MSTQKRNTFQVKLRLRENSQTKLGIVLKYLKNKPHFDFKEEVINSLIAKYYPHAVASLQDTDEQLDPLTAWESIGQLEGYIKAIKQVYGISEDLVVRGNSANGQLQQEQSSEHSDEQHSDTDEQQQIADRMDEIASVFS